MKATGTLRTTRENNKNLWKEVPKLQCSERPEAPAEGKKKTATISNFLRDLHVDTRSNTDSEIIDIFDMRYSESFRSLKT